MRPRLAFFPGVSGSGAFWTPVVDRLPHEWDARSLSWPGAGAESPDPAVGSYRDLIAFAAARIADDSDVVAQSMGGIVAIGLALTRPEKIRRLVCVATSGGVDVDRLRAQDWREEYRDAFPEAGRWVTDDRVDYTERLHRVTAPTCLIWGDADPISPLRIGHALHRLLPSSVLHVVAGGTHTLARDHADEVAALITDHLSEPA